MAYFKVEYLDQNIGSLQRYVYKSFKAYDWKQNIALKARKRM